MAISQSERGLSGTKHSSLLRRPPFPAVAPPPPFLVMQTVSSEVVCVLFRQEGGISQLTFWKCHKRGEKHRAPSCTAVKISQLGREMLMREFSSLKHVWRVSRFICAHLKALSRPSEPHLCVFIDWMLSAQEGLVLPLSVNRRKGWGYFLC